MGILGDVMFIKVENGIIKGHDYYSHDDFNIEVDDQILIDMETGLYKYTYTNGNLSGIQLSSLQFAKTAMDLAHSLNREGKQYLESTDWLIIREMDSGVACPDEVRALRAAARLKVI